MAANDEQGVEEAAILLMSLGEEEAAEVFKHLTPKEVQKLGETIARLRTYGQVTKALRGLRLDPAAGVLPSKGDKVVKDGREVGYVTSAIRSPRVGAVALGYVRRECNAEGTALAVRTATGESPAPIVPTPFTA